MSLESNPKRGYPDEFPTKVEIGVGNVLEEYGQGKYHIGVAQDKILKLVEKAEQEARVNEVSVKMAYLLMDKRMGADDAIQYRLSELREKL